MRWRRVRDRPICAVCGEIVAGALTPETLGAALLAWLPKDSCLHFDSANIAAAWPMLRKEMGSPGIAAVTARLETYHVRVIEGACPNLLREACFHRYSEDRTDRRSETPVDEHSHALDALRLFGQHDRLPADGADAGQGRGGRNGGGEAAKSKKREEKLLSLRYERLWTRIV